jgi:hypothetical protein
MRQMADDQKDPRLTASDVAHHMRRGGTPQCAE